MRWIIFAAISALLIGCGEGSGSGSSSSAHYADGTAVEMPLKPNDIEIKDSSTIAESTPVEPEENQRVITRADGSTPPPPPTIVR